MNRAILVTGATGFIGRHFLRHLSHKDYHLRVLVRSKSDALNLKQDHVEQYVGDLTLTSTLAGICDGIDSVFHLAGFAHADKEDVHQHESINYLGTKHLLEEAKRAQVKQFIYLSSSKAADNDDQTAYAKSKRAAEACVIASRYEMHVSVLRPALVYGPGVKGNLASMLKAIDTGFFPPIPETHNCRSLISVDDLCQAMLLASVHPNAHSKTYAVTDNIDYSTRDIYELMCKALGIQLPRWHIPFVVFRLLAYAGDSLGKLSKKTMPFNTEKLSKLFGSAKYDATALKTDLGFKPADHLESVLPEIVEAYRQENLRHLTRRHHHNEK